MTVFSADIAMRTSYLTRNILVFLVLTNLNRNLYKQYIFLKANNFNCDTNSVELYDIILYFLSYVGLLCMKLNKKF
jgi:hypothetical protein